jgi:hypothetical protein
MMKNNIPSSILTMTPAFLGLSASKPIETFKFNDKEGMFDRHYELEIGVLISGKAKQIYSDHELMVRPGQVWLANMWEPHGMEIIEKPSSGLVIFFFPPMMSQMHFTEEPRLNLLTPFFVPPSQRPGIDFKDYEKKRTILSLAKKIITYQSWLDLIKWP